ncbi:19235_t:CDS:2 [Entrophospora sp. SA101]|nr:19235_t:CDS:2 [Entrophospora sp. SA101]
MSILNTSPYFPTNENNENNNEEAEFENENASKVTIIDGSRTMICIKNNLGILRLMNLNTNILKTLLEFGDRNGSVFILIFTSIDRKLSELDGKSGSDFYFEIVCIDGELMNLTKILHIDINNY